MSGEQAMRNGLVRKSARLAGYSLAALGVLMLLVTLAPPRWYINWLAGEWTEPKGPVLIVLGGEGLNEQMLGQSSYWRSVYAVWAWQEGGFEHIVLSGERNITAPMRQFLIASGVPEDVVIVEERSNNTHENAELAGEVLSGLPEPYVLMTSDYHVWRARRAFERAGIDVETRPVPDAGKRVTQWTQRWNVFLDLCEETVKILYYRYQGWI